MSMVLRYERDAWSMVKRLRQATHEYPLPSECCCPQQRRFLYGALVSGVDDKIIYTSSRSYISYRSYRSYTLYHVDHTDHIDHNDQITQNILII